MKIYIEGTITLDDDESTTVKFSSCNYDEVGINGVIYKINFGTRTYC